MCEPLIIDVNPYVSVGVQVKCKTITKEDCEKIIKHYSLDTIEPTPIRVKLKTDHADTLAFFTKCIYPLCRRWGIHTAIEMFDLESHIYPHGRNNIVSVSVTSLPRFWRKECDWLGRSSDKMTKEGYGSSFYYSLSKYFETKLKKEIKAEQKAKTPKTEITWSTKSQSMLIPDIGLTIKLIESWDCTIVEEHRNNDLLLAFNIIDKNEYYYRKNPRNWKMTFSPGTILVCDRVYIRQQASYYSSISWRIKEGNIEYNGNSLHLKKGRFFVKLKDANKIKCVFDENSWPKY